MERITIFTGELNYAVRKGIIELLLENPTVSLQIIHSRPKKSFKKIFKNQFLNFKKNGWRWIPYEIFDIYQKIASRTPINQASTTRPGQQYDESELRGNYRISIVEAVDIYSSSILEAIRTFSPDLGIALAAPILRKEVFSLPTLGTINLHKGKVPDYRGMPPAFWEMWNEEKEVGCTVHQISSTLDAGDILLQTTVPINKYSTLKGMQLSLDEIGISLICEAVKQIKYGSHKFIPQNQGGRTYRKPTLKQHAQLKRKYKLLHHDPVWKIFIKNIAKYTYLKTYAPIRDLFNSLRNDPEICILLFHRVNDEQRDSVTVGIEQFEHQMHHISRHYNLVSIEEIIDRKLPVRKNRRPYIAVTFDDGYLDNFINAVPILLRHKVPAAFFVSTGMIGEDIGFQHDIDKLGYTLPNMSWDNLRKMKELGFTIGSHTVSHIKCSKESIQDVKKELTRSKEKIKQELSQGEVIFAYPFGGKNDINESTRELVRYLGYKACLSAYGGSNKSDFDMYNILRKGIDFNFSHLSFISRIHGW